MILNNPFRRFVKIAGPKTFFMIMILGLQAPLEMMIVENRSSWCDNCSGLKYFLLYNTGNINNSFFVALCLMIFFDTFSRNINNVSLFLACIISTFPFFYIERGDPADIPFAILGSIFALIVFWVKK